MNYGDTLVENAFKSTKAYEDMTTSLKSTTLQPTSLMPAKESSYYTLGWCDMHKQQAVLHY